MTAREYTASVGDNLTLDFDFTDWLRSGERIKQIQMEQALDAVEFGQPVVNGRVVTAPASVRAQAGRPVVVKCKIFMQVRKMIQVAVLKVE